MQFKYIFNKLHDTYAVYDIRHVLKILISVKSNTNKILKNGDPFVTILLKETAKFNKTTS